MQLASVSKLLTCTVRASGPRDAVRARREPVATPRARFLYGYRAQLKRADPIKTLAPVLDRRPRDRRRVRLGSVGQCCRGIASLPHQTKREGSRRRTCRPLRTESSEEGADLLRADRVEPASRVLASVQFYSCNHAVLRSPTPRVMGPHILAPPFLRRLQRVLLASVRTDFQRRPRQSRETNLVCRHNRFSKAPARSTRRHRVEVPRASEVLRARPTRTHRTPSWQTRVPPSLGTAVPIVRGVPLIHRGRTPTRVLGSRCAGVAASQRSWLLFVYNDPTTVRYIPGLITHAGTASPIVARLYGSHAGRLTRLSQHC